MQSNKQTFNCFAWLCSKSPSLAYIFFRPLENESSHLNDQALSARAGLLVDTPTPASSSPKPSTAPVVVEPDLVCNHQVDVRQAFKAVPVRTLLFQRADQPLHHSVLLRRVSFDEFLLQSVGLHQRAVAAADEYQAVANAQQEALCHQA